MGTPLLHNRLDPCNPMQVNSATCTLCFRELPPIQRQQKTQNTPRTESGLCRGLAASLQAPPFSITGCCWLHVLVMLASVACFILRNTRVTFLPAAPLLDVSRALASARVVRCLYPGNCAKSNGRTCHLTYPSACAIDGTSHSL